jgi:hypothetical protein
LRNADRIDVVFIPPFGFVAASMEAHGWPRRSTLPLGPQRDTLENPLEHA